MKIVFIYSGAENLGIEYISSVLKSAGHDVHLLFDPAVFCGDNLINNKLLAKLFNIDNEIVNKAIGLQPDLVGFSAYTGNYQWCLKIAFAIKKLSAIPIVFGGVHTTAVPEIVLANDCIDFAIIGEGEYAMLDLLKHLNNGDDITSLRGTPNICYRYDGEIFINPPRPYLQDLDALPFPDKMLFFNKVPVMEEQFSIATSRGCPFSCTYCSNDMYHETYGEEKVHVRRRSPDNVIAELIQYKKRGRIKLIAFVDDVFTSSKSWLEEFIPKYRAEINVPFWCSVHPLTITQEKAYLLKAGGCCMVTMGIQNGSERIRTEVFNRKGTNELIANAVMHIKNAGIKISVDNIFGAPTETEEDLRASYGLYRTIKADRILTFWLTYYPRTSIVSYATAKNELTQQDVEDIEKGHVGFTHGTGAISKKKAKLYYKYELLFHLRSLIHSDKIYNFAIKLAGMMPIKRLASRVIIVLNALVNNDSKFFFLLKYLWAHKNTP